MKILRKIFICLLILILLPCIFIATLAGGGFGSTTHNDNINAPASLNPQVLSYKPYITEYAKKIGMDSYIDLILAVMQIESNGFGSDPMQASEGSFNKRYPQIPNGIKDPYYSIQAGMQELQDCIKRAGVKDAKDIEKIKVAVAGYNFGNGFIEWLDKQHGGVWSLEAATEFSDMMAKKLGWTAYGDPPYANKVMNYYTAFDYISGDGDFIIPMKHAVVTSGFGPRLGGYHYGVDISGGYGEKIYAPIDAKVYAVYKDCDPNGGHLGNMCPIGDHATGGGNYIQLQVNYQGSILYILMCHMKTVYPAVGDTIKKGQAVGEQGQSGNSTGSHVHIEIHKDIPNGIGSNNNVIDPSKLINFNERNNK